MDDDEVIESISSSEECILLSNGTSSPDPIETDSDDPTSRRRGGFIRCCGCQRWTRYSDKPSHTCDRCTGVHCGQCFSWDHATGIVLCFSCTPTKTTDISFPGVRPLIIARHHEKVRGVTPSPTCQECNDDNQFGLPCVWCGQGLCLACSNWIAHDVALCTKCLVTKGEHDEPYYKYRGMTIPFFGISENLHPSILMFTTSTGRAFESMERYRMRRGIYVGVSNTSLTLSYHIGLFAHLFPPSGETCSQDNLFLYHENTNDGDVIKVGTRKNGHVILSWAVVTAIWFKLALTSMARSPRCE